MIRKPKNGVTKYRTLKEMLDDHYQEDDSSNSDKYNYEAADMDIDDQDDTDWNHKQSLN